MRIVRFASLLALVFVTVFTLGFKTSDPPGTQMATFAESFLGSLTDAQRAVAVVDYDSPDRTAWHFIPMKTRKGLVLRKMNDAQRTAALRMLRAALSQAGYFKADQIMQLEGVLRRLEGDGRNWERDPQKYFVTIFGTPNNRDQPWGMSFEGHHLSLNFVCQGGEVIDSTPQFFAANPATVMNDVEGPIGEGTRVLRDEEELAFELVRSFDAAQAELAIIDAKAPREIRFAGRAQPEVTEPAGIPYGKLDQDQKAGLRHLVSVYAGVVPEAVSERRMAKIDASDWREVHFAWAGATKPGIGHYYRIEGPTFLIEFVNTQPDAAGNPANHIHAVWRDMTGDFALAIQ